MIIVSQDKEKIINFDNMTRVYITFDEDDDDVCIRTETVDSLFEDLGYYKTEGRAQEVLQEIVNTYVLTEQYKVEDERTRINLMMEGILLFEMPAK